MKDYLLLPQAPLVIRSGRPFGSGSRDGGNFPMPSTLAGVMRTQVMDEEGWPLPLSAEHQKKLQKLSVVGPILARRENEQIMPWVPKPSDALLLLDEDKNKRYCRLAPGTLTDSTGCDLPHGLQPVTLGKNSKIKGKPQTGPSFWPLDRFLAWRQGHAVEANIEDERVSEIRTHVALDSETRAANPGSLFQSVGMEFGRARRNQASTGFTQHDWGLLCRFAKEVKAGMVTVGGERRLSWLENEVQGSPLSPDPGYLQRIESTGYGFSLSFITPAIFHEGWKPGWLDENLQGEIPGVPGMTVTLCAAAIDRWQSVSGWDLNQWAPRASRKAVTAGATYWFTIEKAADGWAEKLWLAAISDEEQDRRDGFGAVIPGIWSKFDNQGR